MKIRNPFLCLFITAFLFIALQSAYGQLLYSANHQRYVIKTINIESGLLNNTVNDIITDTFGFTWVATKTGLQRYNGYRLETIQPLVNGKPQTINYQVYFLKTTTNRLWITYKDGILQYNPFSGKFSTIIQVASNDPCPLRPLQDTQEGIWCAQENGIALYTPEGRLIKTFFYPDSVRSAAIASPRFRHAVSSRNIFLLSSGNDVLVFNKQSGAFTILPVTNGVIASFTNTENKLYILHKNGITVYDQSGNGVFTAKNHFIQNNRFLGTIKVFGKGVLVSIDQHLLLMDSNCTQASEITTLNSKPIISVGSMRTIYEDQFKRLWVITNNDIKVILNYTIPFQYFAYDNTTNFSKSIYVDEEKNLVLAGCYDGGLQLYDTLSNPLWRQPLRTDKVKDIAGIEKLGEDEYLITTISQGWYIFNLSKKRFTPVLLSEAEENRLHTHSIIWTNNLQRLDSSNIIITTSGDVIQCRFKHNRLIYSDILFHDENKQIFYFHFNKNDHCLWIGDYAGLLICKKPDGSIDTLSIPGNYQIRCITTDAQNNVWAGTDKGLFVYNKKHQLIHTFTTANGLMNDCIYSMLTSKDNTTIYAATNLGLSAIQLGGIQKNFMKERGLQENEFNSAAIAKTTKGKLFFGGVNGVTAFYPSDITTENDHPSLIVYHTDINDEPFLSDSAVWNYNHYNLTYNQGTISFSLTAFGIYPATDYTYEYKMENFDKYWTTTNDPVNISYHLPPGEYRFLARLANAPHASVIKTIHIDFPFWDQWWFYILLFALVFILLLFVSKSVYQKRYKAQLQVLHVRQQVLAERERISRDLHDNIGAYASAISANVDDVIYQFNASDHTTLQRLKVSAREIIIQLRDSIWALNKENQTVIMLSDRIKNYIQKLQPAYPDLTFDVDENIEQNTTLASITALHVLRIVQEAVHNAIKHSGCSSIHILISSQSPVIISIKDNGRGIPAEPVLGEGLKNMQARAADIGWQVSITNELEGCCVQLCNTN